MSEDRVTHQMVEAACRSFIPHWEECTNEVRADVYADMREALRVSLNTLIEEQAARIEELEQKLRTTSLEALAISDTNNDMAMRIAELENDGSAWSRTAEALNSVIDRCRSDAMRAEVRLSEAVKVLEEIDRLSMVIENGVKFAESHYPNIKAVMFAMSKSKAFITTLGGEKE
jgi:chromosome condensin MukBEF ATPase and DNA-binding subunit MukB